MAEKGELSFSAQLKKFRKDRDLSVEDAARALAIDPAHWQAWESGEVPEPPLPEVLQRITRH